MIKKLPRFARNLNHKLYCTLLYHLQYRDFSNRINASCRVQSFLPRPELPAASRASCRVQGFLSPPTSSRPQCLHALQTSIPTRPPDLHNLHTSIPRLHTYTISIPPGLQTSTAPCLHDLDDLQTSTTSRATRRRSRWRSMACRRWMPGRGLIAGRSWR